MGTERGGWSWGQTGHRARSGCVGAAEMNLLSLTPDGSWGGPEKWSRLSTLCSVSLSLSLCGAGVRVVCLDFFYLSAKPFMALVHP